MCAPTRCAARSRLATIKAISYIPYRMDIDPTVDELVDAFEAGRLDNDAFPHASHVRVAWGLARRYGPTAGLGRLHGGKREIGSRAGRPDAYHVTITRAWFELISSVD